MKTEQVEKAKSILEKIDSLEDLLGKRCGKTRAHYEISIVSSERTAMYYVPIELEEIITRYLKDELALYKKELEEL